MRSTSSRQKAFIIGLIVFSVFFQPTLPFHWAGTRLYDLETVTAAAFTTEASFWTCSSLVTANVLTSKCGNDYIMGGYNVMAGSGATYYGQYFTRVYSTLPSHNQINLSVKIVPVDSWDGLTVDDHFSIAIDGTEIYGWRIYAYTGTYAPTDICGNTGWNDYPAFTAYLTYPHSSTTSLILKFISYLNENSGNKSLGFRDIIIDFVTVPSPSSTLCGVNTVPLTDKPCACPDSHQYPNPALSGTCAGCDVTCNTCTGGTSNDCTSCYAGRYLSGTQCLACTSPCSTCSGGGTNQCITCVAGYFLVGSTCYPTCDYPLYSTTSGSVVSCNTPCPGTFALWDGTCTSPCSSPLVATTSDTYNLCTFPCSNSGQVLYWNSTCKDTCPYPLQSVVSHSRTFCNYPCGTSQWLYFNGSCLNSCDGPLYSMVEGIPSRKFCYYLCDPDEFLYWDTTCHSDCPFPLSKRIEGSPLRNYCDYPCQPSDFLFWNGSCLATCPIALTTRIEGTPLRKYCDFPCDTDEYSYWNGSCFDTCDFPLSTRIEGNPLVRKFCDFPCQPSEYLYKNAFCYATCDSPYIKLVYGTPSRMFCNFPCKSHQYWSYFGECWNSCPAPYTKVAWNDDKFCNNPCPSASKPYYSQETGQCVKSCELPSIVDWTLPYLSCTPYHIGSLLDAPMDPKAVTLVSLIKPMQYVRYMDINMPFRLWRIGLSQARSVMTIRTGINIWNGARTAYSEEGVFAPGIFESHGLSPSFMVNFWQDFTLIWMGLAAAFIFAFLENSGFRYGFELLGAIFGRLAKIFAINFLLMVVAYDIDDIILFAGIQFQRIKVGVAPWYTAFSIILCLVCIGAAVMLILGVFYIVRKRMRGELTVVPVDIDGVVMTFEKRYQWCQIFWRGFNSEESKYNQYFYLIYVLRIAFPMLMVSCLYKHPLAIVIIELIVNMGMIGLIIYMKPFEKRINYIQILLYETTIFMMNVCMLVLTIRDHLGWENLTQSSVVTGDIIILGNVFVNFMTIIFTLIKLYLEGLEIFYVWRDNSKVEMKFKIAMWFQLLAVPLQQCNFWFEELIPSGVPTYPYRRGFIIDIETEARLKAGRDEDRGVVRTHDEGELMTTQRPLFMGKGNNESQMTMRTNYETSNLNLDTSPEIPIEVPRKERKRRERPKERDSEEVFFVNRGQPMPVPVVSNVESHMNNQNPNVMDFSNIEMSAAVKRNIEAGMMEKKGYGDDLSLFDE